MNSSSIFVQLPSLVLNFFEYLEQGNLSFSEVLSSNSVLIFSRIEIIIKSKFQSQRLQPSLCFWVSKQPKVANSDDFRRGERTNDLSLVGGTSKTIGLLVSYGILKGVAYAPHLRKLSKKSPSQILQKGKCSQSNTGYFLVFKERNTSSFIRTQAKNLVKKINFLVCFTHCVSFLFSLFQNHDRKESVRNRTRATDCAKKIVFPRTVRSCVKTPFLAVSALRP